MSELAAPTGVAEAGRALGVSRATCSREHREAPTVPATPVPPRPRQRPARALSAAERAAVLAHLQRERFVDHAPADGDAPVLDEGV